MAATYTIKTAKNAGTKANPHGGQLVKLYLTVVDEQGNETPDVYCQRKPGNEPNPGDTIYGRLEQGEYGWRLYPEQNPNGSQGRPQAPTMGTSATPSPEFWAAKDRRIGRAGMMQAVVSATGHHMPADDSPTEFYVAYVNRVTDALIASLDERTPPPNEGADVGGGGESPASPSTADVSAKGFVSKPQQDLFERLLREAGAKPETVNAILLYASEALSGRQGGAISEAIDGLKSADESVRRSTGKTLALAANEWRERQPNAPSPDTTDLPPADESVGAAGEDIPF